MKALQISARYNRNGLDGEASLLVYDVASIDGATIGDDVRDVIERRPITHSIYVLAPFLKDGEVEFALSQGTALQRAGAIGDSALTEVSLVGLRKNGDNFQVVAKTFNLQGKQIVTTEWQVLASALIEGWLFNLFDAFNGLVNAPVGVHFSKASGKHASKFLRTSSILLSSEACGLVAFFALGTLPSVEPRRVFVDTAPLLSVAFALQRIAAVRGIWHGTPPSKSFSSYGGVNDSLRIGRNDLVLISASTSGGLAKRLIELGAEPSMILTLYALNSSLENSANWIGKLLCDLTFSKLKGFGYPAIDNQPAAACSLCEQGYVLAELEGDQFLLEKRAVKRLRVGAASQSDQARAIAEELSRKLAVKVRLQKSGSQRIDIDIFQIASASDKLASAFARLLTRFAPTPIDFIVRVGVQESTARHFFENAGLEKEFDSATVVDGGDVNNLPAKKSGNAVVLVPFLCDHALLRGINAQLRPKVDGGCVAYIAGLTIADSARNMSDLRIFLQFGEHGPETFIFRSVREFMLPWSRTQDSAWAAELALLQRIQSYGVMPDAIKQRLDFLQNTALAAEELFLPGLGGKLDINPDFVLLNTKDRRELISQGDVFLAVSNCVAAARCNNVAIDAKVTRDSPTPTWRQTVFGQSVLCPSNFRDFNDAVLRAALLRAADVQELNYCVDEVTSEEMLDVIRAELNSWPEKKGDSLPEFLLSIACRRLRLTSSHLAQLGDLLDASSLPDWLQVLAKEAVRSQYP